MNDSIEWIYDDAELKKLSEDFINQYVDEKLTKRGTETYNCPFCGSGTKSKGTPAFHYSHTKRAYHCFSCGESGHDLYYLIGAVEGIDGYQNRIARAMEYSGVQLKKHRNPDYNGSIPWGGVISDDGHNSTKAPVKAQQSAGTAAGVSLSGPKTAEKQPKVYIPEIEDTPKIDFAPEVIAAHEALKNAPVALDYYHGRGLSDEIIERYKLGYWQAGYNDLLKNHPGNHAGGWKVKLYSYVLPYPSIEDGKYTYFLTEIRDRRQVDEYNDKYRKITKKETGIAAELFNERYLMQETPPDVVFVCEGIYDALSVEMCGGYAIAFVGTAHQRFLKLCRTYKPKTRFVISLDNDGPGAEFTKKVMAGLDSLRDDYKISIPYIVRTAPDGKDYNDSLQADPDALKEFVQNVIDEVKALPETPQKATESPQTAAAGEGEESTDKTDESPENATEAEPRPDNILLYLQGAFDAEREQYRNGGKATGFTEWDRLTNGLHKGIYMLAAPPGSGKTTLAWQMCENLALAGEECLYFTLEQSKLDLVTKSIIRRIKQQDMNTGATIQDVKDGTIKAAQQQREIIQEIGDRISIIEGNFSLSARDICDRIEIYIRQTGKKPVVFVDYLQALKPLEDKKRTGNREAIEDTTDLLSGIKNKHDLTMIVISSISRVNYRAALDIDSLKESGRLEFSADAVYCLEYACMYEDSADRAGHYKLKELFESDGDINKKKSLLADAKAKNPRYMMLKCVKSRYCGGTPIVKMKYYSDADLFMEESDFTPDTENENPFSGEVTDFKQRRK